MGLSDEVVSYRYAARAEKGISADTIVGRGLRAGCPGSLRYHAVCPLGRTILRRLGDSSFVVQALMSPSDSLSEPRRRLSAGLPPRGVVLT